MKDGVFFAAMFDVPGYSTIIVDFHVINNIQRGTAPNAIHASVMSTIRIGYAQSLQFVFQKFTVLNIPDWYCDFWRVAFGSHNLLMKWKVSIRSMRLGSVTAGSAFIYAKDRQRAMKILRHAAKSEDSQTTISKRI